MTGSPRIVDLPVEGEGLILLVAAGIGVLLLLNILMILICAWRRSKKNGKGKMTCDELVNCNDPIFSVQFFIMAYHLCCRIIRTWQ